MTREQTTILKSVAILMMLFLHLFNNPDIGNFCDPLIFLGGVPLVNIISRACNPVGIFLMLSGYGLSYTYFHSNLSFKGQSRRLLKLYIHYWLILLIFVSIGHFVNASKYPGSITDIILNITSLSSSYNSETWFLFPYMLLSFTSIWIFKTIDKVGCVFSLIISGFLYVVSCYVISRYIAPTQAYTAWYNYILIYFNTLFPFVIGAIFHRQVEQGRTNIPFLKSNSVTAPLILFTLFILNCFISSAITSPFFEFAYIFLLLHINFTGILKRFLLIMGKLSLIIWLTHSFFCYYLFHDFIYGFKYPLLIYIVLISISYLVSIPIMFIANKTIQVIPHINGSSMNPKYLQHQ